MTHIYLELGARGAAQPMPRASARPSVALGFDPAVLQAAITDKRADVAILEADWAEASERAVARSAGRARLADRGTWDRCTWTRYLDAAAACQDLYLPRLRRLYSEIARLEQLQLSLPSVRGRAA
jgi:hypothetical protein